MSIEESRSLVKRYDDEILNGRNYAALPDLVTDDLVDPFAPPGSPGGCGSTRQSVETLVAASRTSRSTARTSSWRVTWSVPVDDDG